MFSKVFIRSTGVRVGTGGEGKYCDFLNNILEEYGKLCPLLI